MSKDDNRVSAKSLVATAACSRGSASWLERLSEGDRKYVDEVIAELRAAHGAPLYTVADRLIDVLALDVKRNAVYTAFKRILNDKA